MRGEAAARDRSEYEPKKKEETSQPQIRQGTFFLQTQNGKFLYACLGEGANVIVLPIGTIPLSELSQIAKESLTTYGYRPVEPKDYNYVIDSETLPMKKTQPTPELLTRRGKLTLISREPILSDITHKGNEKPNWGRVEIGVSDHSSNPHEMDVVTLSGEYINYSIPWDSLIIQAFPYDLSRDGSPDKEKAFYSNRRKYGARAYAVVKNKEEYRRLITPFWQIIKRIIGDDRVIAVSSKPRGMLPLTLGEAKKKYYDVRPVVSQKRMQFKGAKLEFWDYKGEGFPIYYFPMGNDEVGLLIDRSNSGYMIPYLFSKTKWYIKKGGIEVRELENTNE